jgi:hypothetical protein
VDELETFLDEKLVTPYKTAILGDFNVHVDSLDNRDSNKFAKIVSNAGFIQHVNGPTHKHGHTLDLVMSRDDEDLIHEIQIDPLLHSDHHVVKCTILCAKPPPLKISTNFVSMARWTTSALQSFFMTGSQSFRIVPTLTFSQSLTVQ